MTYQEAIDYIHSAEVFGIKLGLTNIEKLLNALGNPQQKLKFIHIAGTNGKGSTASMLASSLMAAGYRVGRYISPYIEVFNERIQLNDHYIDDADLIKWTKHVKQVIRACSSQEEFSPTVFEIVTAIGFCYFAAQQVDVVVLEVGMGGRYDSTNIITAPLAAVITPISLDHTQYLGETIAQIAAEKAGIIKAGSIVISKQNDACAARVVADTCASLKVPYIDINAKSAGAEQVIFGERETAFVYRGHAYRLSLRGNYQVENALLAIETLQALNRSGRLAIAHNAIVQGLAEASWPGRFELISQQPLVIIDGAHNVSAVRQLILSLQNYYPERQKVAIFGMMADKNIAGVIDLVLPVFKKIYTVTPSNARAITAKKLADKLIAAGFAGEVVALAELEQIGQVVSTYRSKDSVIVGFGSLYYIGEMRKIVRRQRG